MDDGVFGNLPRSRPGVRSPRRATAETPREEGDAVEAQTAQADASAETPAGDRAETGEPSPSEPFERPTEPAGAERPSGLEDLAWAGIAAAAEAATLGVRLATRALEAVRGNTESR
jgi:hypothetical protein